VQGPPTPAGAGCLSASSRPFVYRSFVTPDKFRVRVIMVPDRARLDLVPDAICCGSADGPLRRLRRRLDFSEGSGVGVVGTKHISSPVERDNAWLRAAAHRAAVEGPEFQHRYQTETLEDQTLPKSLRPLSGLSAVLGLHALGKPGDCSAARQKLCGVVKKNVKAAWRTARSSLITLP
jgi:hypothetical protein